MAAADSVRLVGSDGVAAVGYLLARLMGTMLTAAGWPATCLHAAATDRLLPAGSLLFG